MIAPELVHTLQRLNREEKLQVIQFLKDDLSDEDVGFPKGLRVFQALADTVHSVGRWRCHETRT